MQKLQISIPEPCHENWQNMTPSDRGRFCNACAKTVVDFSMMSDYEVLNYFSTVSDDKVCGRALPNQLGREMTMPREPKKRRFWYWNYVAMFLMIFSKSNQVKAQGAVAVKTEQKPVCDKIRMGAMVPLRLKTDRPITGKVTDDNGKPVPFATVKIKDKPVGVMTDANGNYDIKSKNGDILEISSMGFEIAHITVTNSPAAQNVVLKQMWLGEMVVTVKRSGDSDEPVCTNTKPNQVCEIKVRDKGTGEALKNATLIIKKNGTDKSTTDLTDQRGIYKIRRIKDGDLYTVTITAGGYEGQELAVRGVRTDPGKIVKEVLLAKKQDLKTLEDVVVRTSDIRRQQKELVYRNVQGLDSVPSLKVQETTAPQANLAPKVGGQQIKATKISPSTKIVLGRVSRIQRDDEALLVVDDVMLPMAYIGSMNPNDIQSINVLKGGAAFALYGSDAANGVVIVTTKQKKQNDSLRIVKAVVKKVANAIGISSNPNTINLYPNPVRSGSTFVVSMSIQQPGEMEMQIVDITGRIVLQKQISTSSKDHLEKIETDGRWPAGIYFLNVYKSDGGQQGRLISAVSFVVQ